MTGDVRRPVDRIALTLERAHRRERNGHQRRLGIGRQRQGLDRAFEDDCGQVLAERLVDLLEHRTGGRIGVEERPSHADLLAALPGKNECRRHAFRS